MTFVTTKGGIRLSTHIDGAPDLPWLVLCNSITASYRMWDPQMAELIKKYRVLRYDARGHGNSDAPPAPYAFEDLVADVLGLMDHFEMSDPAFMGLSLGGMTGLGVALTQPKRLSRLVCCDARADAPPPFVQGWNDRIKQVHEHGLASIIPGTIDRWLSAPFRAAHPQAVVEIERMILSTSVDGFEGCAEALKKLNFLDRLAEISIPTLFVVGSNDMGAPPDVMRAMANRVTGAHFGIVEGSAHLPNIDNPSGFYSAIRGFLDLS
jgi:3-oxoadipate enol-lactonase